MWYESLLASGVIPESIIRIFLRIFYHIRFLRMTKNVEEIQNHLNDFISKMDKQPITVSPNVANIQHYELPTQFFTLILGKYMKYSCCYWSKTPHTKDLVTNLYLAEEQMLEITCKRAKVKDGDRILDLGCGWGSLSTYIKENYKETKIVAVSNSSTQNEYIQTLIENRDLKDFKVITANIADLELKEKFDVIISVEMFEHMRNYRSLLKKLKKFLKPNGRLFIHIFTDKNYPYFFEINSSRNWMTKYFFRGGLMPSSELPLYFQDHFSIEKVWKISGIHYTHTLNAWLEKMKSNKTKIFRIFAKTYGENLMRTWWNYWKLFFISLAEVFGCKGGNQRFISHYLFKKR
ncbi:MAG: class I SAM-dependent methyltransferase [Promethearchaeota archaeon]|nr:MAG: class I SAM-dependent methyltransferase [Candidatus Lokiarchaeota archaeon]